MSRLTGPSSGYARIAQAEEEEEDHLDDLENDDPYHGQRTISYTRPQNDSVQPSSLPPMQHNRTNSSHALLPRRKTRGHRRYRSNSAVDVKAINARLEKWADEIAQKFKIRKFKGKSQDEEKLEIHHSVFQAPDDIRPATAESLAASFVNVSEDRMPKLQYDDMVESVRAAIELGVHPKMITQGSSGSYFTQNSEGKVVGVFKPKDEEPYATRNPKWTKWIHRNLFPFFFGRACLIPNLSYVSEAAAYVLDTRLQTNLVPYTDIIHLSSISFNYDFWDRRAYYRKKKPLPEKVGSFQVFLKGYQDANIFLKTHSWPDQPNSTLRTAATSKKKKKRWAEDCRPVRAAGSIEREEADIAGEEEQRRKAFWTDELQQSFREELEKLVILDYIMRNTDRGLDNWMIKIDRDLEKATIVAEPPKVSSSPSSEGRNEDKDASTNPETLGSGTCVRIGAIDNSLSWPWKHPDAWRSFPFGWLFLPVSLIGQPFSEKTRRHFLPLLTSKQWWSDTQVALRQCFNHDTDFKERMYARQVAVMKGQAWNVVETLKMPEHGPLELTRRSRVCVWDDLVDIPVVIPLRVSSDDMRRQRREASFGQSGQEDGIDISVAGSSAPAGSFLDIGTQNGGTKQPNRFNVSRQESQNDIQAEGSTKIELSPEGRRDSRDNLIVKMNDAEKPEPKRPDTQRSMTARLSYDVPRSERYSAPDSRRRHFSFSARKPSIEDNSEDDGDLGFAAASDMEGNRKKVIVERLEAVKGKNPFFTWC